MPGPLQCNGWNRSVSFHDLEDAAHDAKSSGCYRGKGAPETSRSHDFCMYENITPPDFGARVAVGADASTTRERSTKGAGGRSSFFTSPLRARGDISVPGCRVVGFETSEGSRSESECLDSRMSGVVEGVRRDGDGGSLSSPKSELYIDAPVSSSRALCVLPCRDEPLRLDFSTTANWLHNVESFTPTPPSASNALSASFPAQPSQALPIPLARSTSPSPSCTSSVSQDSYSVSPRSPRFLRRSSPLGRSPPSTSYFTPQAGLSDGPLRSSHVTLCSSISTARSLVGSFEESIIAGRLASTTRSHSLGGFMAVLAVQAGSASPAKRRLPFTAVYFPELGRHAPPYCASIYLDGSGGPQEGQERTPPSPAKSASRYRVPKKGQIQLVLSNPEGTPLHTFFAAYDLEHLKPRGKTFLRQRTIAVPKRTRQTEIHSSDSLDFEKTLDCSFVECDRTKGSLRYAMQVHFACLPTKRNSKEKKEAESDSAEESRLYIYDCIRVIFAHQQADSESETLQTETSPVSDCLLTN